MELWEQQKGERAKAFCCFTYYRDVGPARTLEKAHNKYIADTQDTIKITQFYTYSQRYNWVERARAYDQHCDEIARLEREEAIKEMEHRHATNSARIQEVAMKVLEHPDLQNLDNLEASKLAWIMMTTANTIEKAGGFERLTLGETTEYVASKVDAELKAEVKSDISVFDKVKRAKQLLEDKEEE